MATNHQAEPPRPARHRAPAKVVVDVERVRAERRVHGELALRRQPAPPVDGPKDDVLQWTILQLDLLDEARQPEHHPALLGWFADDETLPSELASTYRDLWPAYFEGREGKGRRELAVADMLEGDLQAIRRLFPDLRIEKRRARGRPEFDPWDPKFDGERGRLRRIALAAEDARRIHDLWEQAYGSRRRPTDCPAEEIAAARWSEDGDIDEDEVRERLKG